jgi:hypothetical protein
MFSTVGITARDFVTQQWAAGEPLAILIRVLTFIGFVVPDDASCRGTRSAVTGHVTRNAANYRTFNASLSIC